MKSGSWSVRTYLVLIVVVAVVALAAAAGYGYAWSVGQARERALDRMSFRSERAAAEISSALQTGRATIESLARQPGLDAVFAHPKGCALTAAGAGPFTHLRLDIVDPDGRVVCSSGRRPAVKAGRVHSGSGWLADVLGARGIVTDWSGTDGVTDQAAVVVAIPVVDGTGATVGAVALLAQVPGVASALAKELAHVDRASFTIVDRASGRVISTSERGAGTGARASFPSDRAGEWAGVDGTSRLFESTTVSAGPWRVYAGADASTVLADARGTLVRELLIGLVALLVLVAGVWLLNRRVAGPLRAVIDAVARAGGQPEGARVDARGTSELVELTRQFNAMLDVRAGHEAQLLHQATHDGLTGLPNRTLLRDRLDQALLRDRTDTSVAVLFLGLNRFKTVNDSLGHEVGDRVLVEVAERLATAVRPGDTLARFSGDEFVVLCEDLSDDPTRVAARVQRSLEEPFRGPVSDIVLRAAIGITVAQGPLTNPERLLREAASAMAQAKAKARPWWVFDEELQSRATKRLETEHALQRALEREELLVHYQPLLDVAAGRIVAAEALVRWRHPGRGLVPPMDFIPLAEETGQISAIGRFVLARACRQAAAWAAAGRPIRVSVNISVDQLRQGDLAEDVRRELVRSQLPPERLCLEITESSLIREAGQGFGDLTRLRDLGVQLSIDDFGTGYSSLSYLHQLPVDELKIDRSFISQLGRGTRESHLVEAIAVMARALGLGVVAEGVETPGQLEYLAEVGCQLAQGYLIARPQPPEQILGMLPRQADRVPV